MTKKSDILLWLAGAGFLLLLFGFIFLPPISTDELIYHLPLASSIFQYKGFPFSADNIYFYFPQLGESLFSLIYPLFGVLGAKAIHFLCGLAIAAAIYRFSRKYLAPGQAVLSAVIFLTAPSIMELMTLAYVDLFYTLFTFLAVVSMLKYFENGRMRWIFAISLMVGGAMATKYTGFQLLILATIFILIERLIGKRKNFPFELVILPVVSIAVVSPYLIRNYFLTGWPFFPFDFGGLPLKPEINWDPERARFYLGWLGTFGAPIGQESIWHTVLAPILIFIQGKRSEERYYEGVLGPVFLLIPFLLYKKKLSREIKLLGLFTILYFYYWAFTTMQVRFLVPILPVMCVLLGYGLSQTKSKIIRFVVYGLIAFNCLTGVRALWAAEPLNFWLGKESREAYLSRRLGVYFEMYRQTNKIVGPNDKVYLVNTKNYVYYLNCNWTADFVFERWRLDKRLKEIEKPEQLFQFFEANKMTHLLIDEQFIADPKFGLEVRELAIFQTFLSKYTDILVQKGAFVLRRIKTNQYNGVPGFALTENRAKTS